MQIFLHTTLNKNSNKLIMEILKRKRAINTKQDLVKERMNRILMEYI